jgi:predicted esterase
MKKVEFHTQKTARFFQLGEITEQTDYVIIACHGYAQLANYFLKWFEGVENEKIAVIAPEGLNRFYWQGFSGRVAASWMTKEDRESDIADYVYFIDQIAYKFPNKKIIAIGFSQGAATICRWAHQTVTEIEHIVLWGSVFPDGLEMETFIKKFKNPIQLVFGDSDEYYSEKQISSVKSTFSNQEENIEFTSYSGGHKILYEPLTKLLQKITSD